MKKHFLITSIFLLIFSSCIDKPEVPEIPIEETELSFPDGFDFSTSKGVIINVSDNSQNAIYEIKYELDAISHSVGNYNNLNGSTRIQTTIPSTVEEIEIVKKSADSNSSFFFNSSSPVIDVNLHSNGGSAANNAFSTSSDCIDRLYAVESANRGFWSIDLSTGDYAETTLPTLEGGGSIACALDQENGLVYYNVGKKLYAYDVANNTFSVAQEGNPFNGNYPRLEFYGGYFWMSNGSKLYKVDATTNEIVAFYEVSGFVNSNGGGDLAFDSNGELYLACFSGLYKFSSFGEGTATIIRISAENFPFQLTSMAIDREDRIFVATNDANSNLIQISKEDGSYQIVKTYNHKINDLTAWRCSTDELPQQDSDQDGIIDELDDYPNDPDAAFDSYTPSALGMGTLAFEDLWPLQGDYDFNDLVIGYRFINVMNSSNKSVRLKMELELRAIGASAHSGFGIELPFNKTDIAYVSGYSINGSLISLDGNGLESNQSKAVIIVFNDAFDHMTSNSEDGFINTKDSESVVETVNFNITVEFVQPIDASGMNNAPFNPFIFSSYERGKEVHLSGKEPTDLIDSSYFGTGNDDTTPSFNKYYQNSNNMPWAINVIHSFRYPIEKSRIDRAYNKFTDWGKSNGVNYRDWYGDNSGYRNLSRIYLRD